jgi:hypothetical protein
MPRNLTTRQMKFVVAVAGGKTQTAAYKEAGYAANGKPRTTVRNARQLAQNAAVRASIREMQLQLLPAPDDMKAIYAHGLATIIQLSNSCEDSRVSLNAQNGCARRRKSKRKSGGRWRRPKFRINGKKSLPSFARCTGKRCPRKSRWW